MRWIFVRHGQTEQNRQRMYLGHSDVPLNEQGMAEAKSLVERLKKMAVQPAAIYMSDLLRCVQTAKPLCDEWDLAASAVPALRELSFGDWELLTYDQLMQTDRERATGWYDDPFSYSPPNGESLLQLGQRVDEWLHRVKAARNGGEQETLIFVTHGGVIRWFQAAWMESDPSRYWQVEGTGHGEVLVAVWNGRHWIRQSLGFERGAT